MYVLDWNQLIVPAAVLLANITNSDSYHVVAVDYLNPWMCGRGDPISYTPHGSAYNVNDNSLAQTMNSAFLAVTYALSIADTKAHRQADLHVDAELAQQFLCYAQRQVEYILGSGHTYLIGTYGGPTHIYERASSCPSNKTITCNALDALYTASANPSLPIGGLVYGPGPDRDNMQHYDNRTSGNATFVSHAYNAGSTGTLAGLNTLTSGKYGFNQCPSGSGVLDSALKQC